jgi:hypothetical protein
MSRINFNGCKTVMDIERLHGEILPGNVLMEMDETIKWVDGKPTMPTVRMPIFGVYATEKSVLFEAEREIGKRELLAFPAGQMVVTSIVEVGDIFWGIEDGDNVQYTIDDLREADFDFDGLLRQVNEIPTIGSLSLVQSESELTPNRI